MNDINDAPSPSEAEPTVPTPEVPVFAPDAEDAPGTAATSPLPPLAAPPAHSAADSVTISKRALTTVGGIAVAVALGLGVFGAGVLTGSHFSGEPFGDRDGVRAGMMAQQGAGGYRQGYAGQGGQDSQGRQGGRGWRGDDGQGLDGQGRGRMMAPQDGPCPDNGAPTNTPAPGR